MSESPGSICFLSWRDTRHPEGGGSESYVENIARELASAGHAVTIFCARWPGSVSEQVVDGVRYVRSGGRLTVYPRGLAFLLRRRSSFDAVIDVVNGVPFGAGLVRRHGISALIHHVHREQWQIIYPDWRGRLGWFVESRLVTRLYRRRRIISVSESTKRDLISLGLPAESISVVRNGRPAITSDTPRSVTPRLCVIARLVPHKQVEHALRAVAALSGTTPGLTLDLVGAGWWEDELRRTAHDLGIENVVRFHGHVSDSDRDDLLASAWLLLLPSVKEGWGNVVIEAAAHGVPTIAYRSAGGVCESVDDTVTGMLADDLSDLIRQTQELLEDPSTRLAMGEAARVHAQQFDWSRSACEFKQALRIQ